MPLPRISIQPVRLHIGQPAPRHRMQRMSTSALGSVYGKKLGRNRTVLALAEQRRAPSTVSVPLRSASVIFGPTTSPST